MEAVLEIILNVLFAPFETQYDKLHRKVNTIPNKTIRVLLKMLIVFIPVVFIMGIIALVSYLIRGYWI